MTGQKRIAIFLAYPAIAAVLLIAVIIVLIIAWPVILTPWFKLDEQEKQQP